MKSRSILILILCCYNAQASIHVRIDPKDELSLYEGPKVHRGPAKTILPSFILTSKPAIKRDEAYFTGSTKPRWPDHDDNSNVLTLDCKGGQTCQQTIHLYDQEGRPRQKAGGSDPVMVKPSVVRPVVVRPPSNDWISNRVWVDEEPNLPKRRAPLRRPSTPTPTPRRYFNPTQRSSLGNRRQSHVNLDDDAANQYDPFAFHAERKKKKRAKVQQEMQVKAKNSLITNSRLDVSTDRLTWHEKHRSPFSSPTSLPSSSTSPLYYPEYKPSQREESDDFYSRQWRQPIRDRYYYIQSQSQTMTPPVVSYNQRYGWEDWGSESKVSPPEEPRSGGRRWVSIDMVKPKWSQPKRYFRFV